MILKSSAGKLLVILRKLMNKIVLIFVKTEHEWRVFIETEVLLTQIYTAERPSFISPYLIGRSTFEDHCFSQQVLGFS